MPGTFAWKEPDARPQAGGSFAVVFTPADARRYTAVEQQVQLTVKEQPAPTAAPGSDPAPAPTATPAPAATPAATPRPGEAHRHAGSHGHPRAFGHPGRQRRAGGPRFRRR